MADEIDVVGSLSEQQKDKDTFDAKENRMRTVRMRVLKGVEQRQKEFFADGRLLCFRCAKIEYEKAQKDAFENPLIRKRQAVELEKQHLSIIEKNMDIKFDFKKFEDQKNFHFVKEEQKREVTKVNGVKQSYVTTYKTYVCRIRGCGISVQVNEELEDATKPRPSASKKK